jgi:hypothetical protein
MDYATFKLVQRGILQVVPGSTLVVPTSLPGGVTIRLEREISAFKADGSIAMAGEAYHWLVVIEAAGREMRRFNPVGWRPSNRWTQDMVDSEVRHHIQRGQAYIRMVREEQRRKAAQEAHTRSAQAARKAAFDRMFGEAATPAGKVAAGRYVITRDTRLWKVVEKSAVFGVMLQASDGQSLMDTTQWIAVSDDVWPIRKRDFADIRSQITRVYLMAQQEVA